MNARISPLDRTRSIYELVTTAKHLNHAVFMAGASLGDVDDLNAIQALAHELDGQFNAIREGIDELIEALRS